MARYECTLSPDLLEKAVTELNEPRDNEERLKAIDQLRSSFNVEKFGPLLHNDDAFILRFLRAKKFDQDRALTVLQNYHSVRTTYKEVFDKANDPKKLVPIIKKGVVLMLPGPAKNGAAVMLSRNGLLDQDVDLNDLMAYSVLSMEKLLEDEKYQICGVATIKDLKDFSLKIFTKISPRAMGRMTSLWQDAMPLRFKESHILNEGTFYDIVMAIVRPFLRKKIASRIHVHGSNYNALHDYIDPSILPPYLGGTGPDAESLAKIWSDKFTDNIPQDTSV